MGSEEGERVKMNPSLSLASNWECRRLGRKWDKREGDRAQPLQEWCSYWELDRREKWLEPFRPKMAEDSTSSRPWASLHTHYNTSKKDVLFIIGDWNAKVGSQKIPGVTGKFGLGVQNEAGQMLTEFFQENALVIANTLFQQHENTLLMDITSWSIPKSNWL